MESERPGLSRGDVLLCLGLSLAVFLLYQGPFWRHRWQLDASIGVSYLVIPFIVAGVLAYRRRLAVRELLLGSIEVTCWKFGVTYLVAHTVWMFSKPPPRVAPEPPKLADAPSIVGRRATPDQVAAVEGSAVDPSGRGVAGSVVFIESGLEAYAFDVSPAPALVSVGGGAIAPPLVVAELHGELRARSSDGKLHTLIAGQGDTDLFNLPLQSSGAESAAEVRRGQGTAVLRCAVHERSSERARLVVVAHPFHAVLDASGHFAWSGVPTEPITIAVLHPDGRAARVEHRVDSARPNAVSLELPSGP
jgi:hypothetical protein